MRKADAALAVVVAVLVAAGYQWYQHPNWWMKRQPRFDMAKALQRMPRRPPPTANESAPVERNDTAPMSLTTSAPAVTVPDGMFLVKVLDRESNAPITAFKYCRTKSQAELTKNPPLAEWIEIASPTGMYLFAEGPKYVPTPDTLENHRRLQIAKADKITIDADGYEFETVQVRELLQDKKSNPNETPTVLLQAVDPTEKLVISVIDAFSEKPIPDIEYFFTEHVIQPAEWSDTLPWMQHHSDDGTLEVVRDNKRRSVALRARGYQQTQIDAMPELTYDRGHPRRSRIKVQLSPIRVPDGYISIVLVDSRSQRPIEAFSYNGFSRHPRPEEWDLINWYTVQGGSLLFEESKFKVLAIRATGYKDYSVDMKELAEKQAPYRARDVVIRLEPDGTRHRSPNLAYTDEDMKTWNFGRAGEREDRPDSKTSTVEGRVTVNGVPPDSGMAQVMVITPEYSVPAQVGADGYYAVDTLPSGLAQVSVSLRLSDGTKRTQSGDVRLIENQSVEHNVDFPALGSVTGSLTGLRENESGGVFLIKGDLALANVTEDDLYDFGEVADAEARVGQDGTFSIKGVEAGHYTVVALSEHFGSTSEERDFWFVTGTVDVEADGVAEVSLSLE